MFSDCLSRLDRSGLLAALGQVFWCLVQGFLAFQNGFMSGLVGFFLARL